MIKVLSPLLALAMGVSIAACGSGTSTTATGAAATSSSSATSAASGAAAGAKASTHQLATQTQQLLQRLSAQAGVLATGNSTRDQQARRTLQQLHARANSLAAQADKKLAPTNPARIIIAQADRQAGTAAADLQHSTSSPATRSRMRQAQASLSKLAAQVGQVRLEIQKANLDKINSDLQSIGHLLASQASGASSGS